MSHDAPDVARSCVFPAIGVVILTWAEMCWLVLDWSVKIPLSSQMDPVLETAQADTSSIGVLQHPFGARCIVGGPGDAMLERLQRKMDYGMQALNLILVRFLQRKMTSKSVEHSLCEYFKFCRAAKGGPGGGTVFV